jgi:hypothetical protein
MAAEAKRTEADFEEYRRDRAFHTWKQAMWAKGLKLPTQVADGRVQRPRAIAAFSQPCAVLLLCGAILLAKLKTRGHHEATGFH